MNSIARHLGAALLAGGSAAVLATPASAATVTGTVVHRNAHAHSFVVAASGGRLSAIHATHAPRVGRVVRVKTRALRNGTSAATTISVRGTRSHARIRGTVTFVDHRRQAFTVSARGVSILVRRHSAARHARAADALPPVGTTVTVDTGLSARGALEAEDVQRLGEDTDGIELEGLITAVDVAARTLQVSADDDDRSGQRVVVSVPDAIDFSAFATGTEVELQVALQADGTYVLQSAARDADEQEADDQDLSDDQDQGNDQDGSGQDESGSGDTGVDG